jgi:hypothetical protein
MIKSILGLEQNPLVKRGLDVVDAVIIYYIFMKIAKARKPNEPVNFTTHIDYSEIIKDLPILMIANKRSIAKRIDKLVKCGVFSKSLTENNSVSVTCCDFVFLELITLGA